MDSIVFNSSSWHKTVPFAVVWGVLFVALAVPGDGR